MIYPCSASQVIGDCQVFCPMKGGLVCTRTCCQSICQHPLTTRGEALNWYTPASLFSPWLPLGSPHRGCCNPGEIRPLSLNCGRAADWVSASVQQLDRSWHCFDFQLPWRCFKRISSIKCVCTLNDVVGIYSCESGQWGFIWDFSRISAIPQSIPTDIQPIVMIILKILKIEDKIYNAK